MGFLDLFRFIAPPDLAPRDPAGLAFSAELAYRTEVSATAEALAEIVQARIDAFTMADALRLPAVIRARQLLAGTAASFLPLAYRNGAAMPGQPRVVARPDPFHTRYDHVSGTVLSLLEHGCAYWRLGDIDPESGKPRIAYVIPHDDVNVQWDARRFLPVYDWRGTPMIAGRDILHITIGRRPGELHGRGPLSEALPSLQAVYAAEEYAKAWFASGGVPPVVIQATGGQLSQEEATKAKRQWVASRDTGAEPAVFGRDWQFTFPPVDPQRSQMQEARAYGATVVATALGIPAALLHVSTSGATITYTNPAGALEELVKSTVAPVYLAPIEAAWSDLLPNTAAVRFDLADLSRADFAARAAIYAQLIGTVDASGVPVMTAAEARAFEGWSATATEAGHQFDPSPNPAPAPVEVPAA